MSKNKQYPKSQKNKQCVGPCYDSNTSFIHPIYLTSIKNTKFPNKPICPTEEYEHVDEITNAKNFIQYDICDKTTEATDLLSSSNVLLMFQSGFTKTYFLSFYYNINSFDDALEWLNENSDEPLETKERIINTVLVEYYDEITILDSIFVLFYISHIKDKKMYDIYKEIHKNIGINKENELMIINGNNNVLKLDEHVVERINYVAEKFITEIETKNYLIKFFKTKMNLNNLHENNMLNIIYVEHLQYIKNSIKTILL